MKWFGLITLVGLAVTPALAWDVCALKNLSFDTKLNLDQAQIDAYRAKLQKECELSKQYLSLKEVAQKNYQISLEEISIFQAFRYVQTSFYSHAELNGIPVPLIYQRYRANYDKPLADRSPEIWKNWLLGIRQFENIRDQLQHGQKLDARLLSQMHRQFYSVSDETGDFSRVPNPGSLKPESDQDNYWWVFKTDIEAQNAQSKAIQINAYFKNLGLLSELDEESTPLINQVLSVRPFQGGFAIYSGDSRANKLHLEKLFDFFNAFFSQARAGQHFYWRNRLITPGEAAFIVQQLFIDIHPFHEGNGRTSRLLQELILTSFQMPYGASGDLMDVDALTLQPEYYDLAIDKTVALLKEVGNCLEAVYPSVLKSTTAKLTDIDENQIPYRCRLLAK